MPGMERMSMAFERRGVCQVGGARGDFIECVGAGDHCPCDPRAV